MAPAANATRQQLAQVYDDHSAGLFRYLLSFGFDEFDARDCLQEVFVRLARQPAALTKARSQRAVVFRIAHNLAIDLIRRQSVRRQRCEKMRLEAELTSGDVAASLHLFPASAAENFSAPLREAFAHLPDEQATVVQLKLWQGLTFAEIADIQDISQNTAASRYRYGVDKLRALLRPLYEEIR